MTDEKKKGTTIEHIGSRKASLVAAGVKAALENQPAIGGDQGDYVRPPCGTCMSWRRVSQPGMPLDAGQCMWGPPQSHPVTDANGRPIGQMMMRPPVTSQHEGCDQHDDGTEEEGEGQPISPALLQVG
jgi:hypothetical protein